jgi:hypothetical protein
MAGNDATKKKRLTAVRCAIPVLQDRVTERYAPGSLIASDYLRNRADSRPHARALANFEEVWQERQRSQTRYSDGSFCVLYTATTEATARSERCHWLKELAFKDGLTEIVRNVFFYRCRLNGTFSDQIQNWRARAWLVHPTDYTRCNELARENRLAGMDFMFVPSARRLNGCCIPVFNRGVAAVTSTTEGFDVRWDASQEIMYWHNGRARQHIRIDDVYELVTKA